MRRGTHLGCVADLSYRRMLGAAALVAAAFVSGGEPAYALSQSPLTSSQYPYGLSRDPYTPSRSPNVSSQYPATSPQYPSGSSRPPNMPSQYPYTSSQSRQSTRVTQQQQYVSPTQ